MSLGLAILAASRECAGDCWSQFLGGQKTVNRLIGRNMSRIDTYFQLLKDVATYCIVRTVVCVIQTLPIEVCQRLARVFAACCAGRVRSEIVQDNLSQTFPEWREQKRR